MNSIVVNELGKKYKIYSKKWHRVLDWISNSKHAFHQSKWVLKDLSFTVNKGESMGIIGQNGAGKSTLLKLLTGIIQPTEGSIEISGKVSALLELGIGFHPDFTGRQNVFMMGQLMGLSHQEITRLFPSIEEFAEIGNYIDQPTKTYSSGMAVRLAFSVATAVRPDILIVDEALSVGDAYFQHKCFRLIKEFRKQGTTLLFVSHDPAAIKNLCDRAILLEKGSVIKQGKPEEVLDYYNAAIAKKEAEHFIQQSQENTIRKETRSGDQAVCIESIEFFQDDKQVFAVQVGDEVEAHITVEILKEFSEPNVGLLFRDRLGNDIAGTNTHFLGANPGAVFPGQKLKIVFRFQANFGVGHYSITTAFTNGPTHLNGNYEWWDNATMLQVIPGNEPPFVGVCYIPIDAEFINIIND